MQVEFWGAPLQLSVTAPLNPLIAVTCRLYVAGLPAVTVAVAEPPDARPIEKSVPEPESPTDCGLLGELSVNCKDAASAPVVLGVKVTLTEHVALTATVAPLQLLALIAKSPALAPLTALDLERGMLQVRQSAWRGKLGDPKTDESIRVVELSPQACRHLRTFLDSWHPNQRRLLFATRNGTPWDQNLLLKRKFRPLLRALSIQVPRGNGFHAFRHANATLMSSFGASQKLRQQRLGHADGSPVTETIYTHVISEDGKRIATQLGNAVWGILDASWTEKENGSRVESPKPFVIN
jgi:Phage integrase family